MYRTTRPLNPSGVFTDSHYVVSMRPYKADDVEKVREVTRPYTGMHGEPIAWGWDAVRQLGIEDIEKPEFGDVVEIRREVGEVPVFLGLRCHTTSCRNGGGIEDSGNGDGACAGAHAGIGYEGGGYLQVERERSIIGDSADWKHVRKRR